MSVIRNDIIKVKKTNIELIKSALKAHPESTKAQIAALTGISVVTCGKILNELKKTGEVLEGAHINTGCGRPATTFRFNANYASVACLFLWSDRGRLELVSEIADLIGQVIFSEVTALHVIDYNVLEQKVDLLLRKQPSIQAIAIGVPGTVHNGVISSSYLLPLNGMALQEKLSAAFPHVQIMVESAARAAAYGYSLSENITSEDICAYFFIPTSVRTGRSPHEILTPATPLSESESKTKPLLIDVGLVCDHKIIRGASGLAGSMGLFLPPDLYGEIPAEVIANLFSMLIPILNPRTIAVTGSGLTEERLQHVRMLFEDYLSPEYLPQLKLRPDCRQDYANGLTLIALQMLSCGIELVQKRI